MAKRMIVLDIPDNVKCFTLTIVGYDDYSRHGHYENPPIHREVMQEVIPEWFVKVD